MVDSSSAARRQTFCLNMIVKNEAPVIRRCLDSVRPLIDHWVIVDTGSTDGTQELVRDALKELPGELHERPWVDFAHNRTEALELARGRADYIVVIDADEVVVRDDGLVMPWLTDDVYSVAVRYSGCSYTRRQFLRDGIAWRFEGVLHEYVTAPQPVRESALPGLTVVPHHDGARARDPFTYRRDALVLERALLEEPENARYVFYLAQSYRDAMDLELALRYYRKRAAMGGWREEAWYALYQAALIQERMRAPWGECLESYLAAYQLLPDRAEPLYRIGTHYASDGDHHAAYLFLSRAAAVPAPPVDGLFVERPLYEFHVLAELAVSAHYAGDYTAAVAAANTLLRSGGVPGHAVDRVIANRRFSVDALVAAGTAAACDPGALHVVVAFCEAGPELDDCIDSLFHQGFAEWEAWLVDDGSTSRPGAGVPDDPRFTLARYETAHGVEARIDEHLRGMVGSDRVVLVLSPHDRLADISALERIRAAFADPECQVAYSQFRSATGALGDAEPAAGEADFRARGASLASHSAVALRAHAWRGSMEATWQHAGLAGTRFLDDVITVRGAARPPRIRVAAPPAAEPAQPKISCLMVTLDRLSLAKRAIQSYADQSYPNRELVIVTDGTLRFCEALQRHVDAAGVHGVRLVRGPAGETLGALRNLSLDHAAGEVVCQWDDDDCSHPERLSVQFGHMLARGARASFLADHLHLVADQRTVSWVDWTQGGAGGCDRVHPGTLMMFADPRFQYPETGPYARRGEDSALLDQVHAVVSVAHLRDAGHLYLYEYHGRNAFSRAHHLNLACYRTTAAHLLAHADVLREALTYYRVPRPATVLGREGAVLALS